MERVQNEPSQLKGDDHGSVEPVSLFSPLRLPNGAVLGNRIAKAAMEESMSAVGQVPGRQLVELYRRWGRGGIGLLLTGNVMVDARALTGPGGVVLDAEAPLAPFAEWAAAAKADGAAVWMQINHPGRQVRASMPGVAWAPSAVALDMGRTSRLFAQPVEMSSDQIHETINRFVTTAVRAEQAGFDGVEVHAAHGYLLSQFLSPLVNQRQDEWGGSLANRARMLTDIVSGIRARTAPGFAVAVKLNSADFQRGGFDATDAREVIDMLAPLGVDLVELSGGSYESPAMTGNVTPQRTDARTRAREAYFLELAEELVRTSPLPLMVTGGIVRRQVAEEVLASGVAMVGMGTALAVQPDLPALWRRGVDASVDLAPVTAKDKALASAMGMSRVRHQMRRLGRGRPTQPGVSPLFAWGLDEIHDRGALRRYRRWLSARS